MIQNIIENLTGRGKAIDPAIALRNIKIKGEYEAAKATPPTLEVITAGNPTHKHHLQSLAWDTTAGPDVTDFGKFTATFKTRYGCTGCSRVVIESHKTLF